MCSLFYRSSRSMKFEVWSHIVQPYSAKSCLLCLTVIDCNIYYIIKTIENQRWWFGTIKAKVYQRRRSKTGFLKKNLNGLILGKCTRTCTLIHGHIKNCNRLILLHVILGKCTQTYNIARGGLWNGLLLVKDTVVYYCKQNNLQRTVIRTEFKLSNLWLI